MKTVREPLQLKTCSRGHRFNSLGGLFPLRGLFDLLNCRLRARGSGLVSHYSAIGYTIGTGSNDIMPLGCGWRRLWQQKLGLHIAARYVLEQVPPQLTLPCERAHIQVGYQRHWLKIAARRKVPETKENLLSDQTMPNPKSWVQATRGTRARNTGALPETKGMTTPSTEHGKGEADSNGPPPKKPRHQGSAATVPPKCHHPWCDRVCNQPRDMNP